MSTGVSVRTTQVSMQLPANSTNGVHSMQDYAAAAGGGAAGGVFVLLLTAAGCWLWRRKLARKDMNVSTLAGATAGPVFSEVSVLSSAPDSQNVPNQQGILHC